MSNESDDPENHRQRSEYIRRLVQRCSGRTKVADCYVQPIPKTIVQFWHDLRQLPPDVEECIRSWTRWKTNGYSHRLFDERVAGEFIDRSLGSRYKRAYERCYHPAMQADYFRLCYLLIEGGFYVDADDVCVGSEIDWLFGDGRLKLQPLCYDIDTASMVESSEFLRADAYASSWIFYLNNNPLIGGSGHPIVELALQRATKLLELADENTYPEIQSTTGPGNLSKSVFDLGTTTRHEIERQVVVLQDWNSLAVSQWPLSHRDDARNWRLSNQKKFQP